MTKVITHDGVFHADDVMAVAILNGALACECEVIRTRDRERIAGADGYVVDVGGVYDASRRFDHHQKGGAGCRDNGIPYASAGLVWKHFGLQMLQHRPSSFDQAALLRIHDRVDRNLIAPIDAADNGFDLVVDPTRKIADVGPLSVSAALSSYNTTWNELGGTKMQQKRFEEAVDWAESLLYVTAVHAFAAIAAEAEVAKAVRHGRTLVLPTGCPWQEAVLGNEAYRDVLYVVYEATTGPSDVRQFNVQCVPDALGSFGKRKPLPEAWAATEGAELAELTGVADAVFCHAGRFICGAGSRKGALALAKLAEDA